MVAYSVYHVIKNGHLDAIQRASQANNYSSILDLARALADAYAIKFPRAREDQRSTSSSSDPGDTSGKCAAAVGHRDCCKPECADLAVGEHHPSCSAAYLLSP